MKQLKQLQSAPKIILFICEDTAIYAAVAPLLKSHHLDFHFYTPTDTTSLAAILQSREWGVVLCDDGVSHPTPLELLAMVRQASSHTAVIFVAKTTTVQDAVDMMRLGAAAVVELTDLKRLTAIVEAELNLSHQLQVRRSKEAYYHAIVDNQSELICRYDADLRLTFVNRAYSEWRGESVDALVGSTILEQIPPDEHERVLAHVQSLTPDQPAATSIHHSIAPDKLYVIEWTDTAIFDDNGAIIEYQGVGRDVTERELQARQVAAMRDKLEEQHRQVTHLLDTMQDAIIVMKLPERELLLSSAAFEKTYGHSIKDFVDDPNFFRKIVHSDDLDLAIAAMQTCIRDGFTELEHRIVLPSGEIRWLHRRAWVIYDEQGHPIQVNDSARDITDRKQAEFALKASEELYRTLAESFDGVITIADENGQYLYANAQAWKPFNLAPEERIGKTAHDLFPSDIADLFVERVRDVMATGRSRTDVGQMMTGPEMRWFQATIIPLPEPDGTIPRVQTIAFDVTDLMRAESALRASEEKYRSLIESSDAAIALYDAGGDLHYINQLGSQSLGYMSDEIIGMNIRDLFPSITAEQHLAAIQSVIETGQGIIRENVSIIADEERWYRTSVQPVRDATGKIVYALIHASDITRFKASEKALRASEKQYRQMFELHGLPKLLVDPENGQIVDANPAAGQFYGYSVADLKTLRIPDISLVKPDAIKQNMKMALSQDLTPAEVVHRGADGLPHDVDVFVGPIEVEGRKLLYAIITDVTERKRAQQALQEAHDLLEQRVAERTAELERVIDRIEAIFNHSGDGIVLLDVKHGIQQANYAFDTMFGATTDSYVGDQLSAILRVDDPALIEATLQTVAATHQTVHVEIEAQGIHGPIDLEVSIAPVNRSENAVENLVCIIRDITARKRDQAALRESEERYRTTIAAMSEGIVVQNQDGVIELSNAAAEDILGLTEDQIAGRKSVDPRWHAIHEDGTPFLGDTHPSMVALRTGQPQSNIVMGVHKPDGTLSWILINSQPLIALHQERPAAVVTTFTNITARKEAELTLRSALEKEKELGDLKSRFVSMASHEFRTPLTAILATAETLTFYRARMNPDQIDERLDRIRQQVSHMKGIMEDVMALARFQSGRMEFKPAQLDLHALCQAIIEELESELEFRGRLVFECPTMPLWGLFDVRLLRHVITNLMHNALKYSAPDTPVRVHLENSSAGIVLQVMDEGIGIPEDDIKHLFEPFHRAKNVGAIAGTGLGLSIAKQAVEAHGGQVVVESEVDKGTTFTLLLPATMMEEQDGTNLSG